MSVYTKAKGLRVTFDTVHIVEKDAFSSFEREMGIVITHDGRGAPVAKRADGSEDTELLLSLSDENDIELCGWAQRDAASGLVGLGIDLVCLDDFAGKRGEYLSFLILSGRDQGLVNESWPDDPEEGWAFAFSAKEAAFKACGAPLRRWYETHEEELVFDLRGFELADENHAQGTARHGEAQRAMDAMGITRIELQYERRGNYLLTCALAFGGTVTG